MEEDPSYRQKYEGQLCKYTNVVKGWQYRWFILDPQTGTLDYYMTEESKTQKARGSVSLTGAVISPSQEDSLSFTVSAANSEVYKLRAGGTKERHQWISRLRAVVQKQGDIISLRTEDFKARSSSSESVATLRNSTRRYTTGSIESLSATQGALQNAKEIILMAEDKQRTLVKEIESLPTSESSITALDPDCLLLKATSQAAMDCLEDCFVQLQRSDVYHGDKSESDRALSQSMANISYDVRTHMPDTSFSSEDVHTNNSSNVNNDSLHGSTSHAKGPLDINPLDEIPDTSTDSETNPDDIEEHKSVILHLLSQLKLGMDLTRVVLPTFILEKRSLLEMYADFLGHSDQFLRISQMPTPELRMLAAVEYYICSFHIGRRGSIAKKPYNPIIGETFYCSYHCPRSCLHPNQSFPYQSSQSDTDQVDKVKFVAEQVSHHPPVSAFYAECAEHKMYMNGWIWTKSKFLGMSIGVTMVGEGAIHLVDKGEEYRATFPCAYGRSILTKPWMELGGRVTVSCPQTGYNAAITFHTKPFYGGKIHRISGEVKNPESQVICRIQGEWNGEMEMALPNGDKKILDTSKYPGCPKRVRPISKQDAFESRRLWQNVTKCLKVGDVNTATEHKKFLEERQRREEKYRIQTKAKWETKLFHKEGEGWAYDYPLKLKA